MVVLECSMRSSWVASKRARSEECSVIIGHLGSLALRHRLIGLQLRQQRIIRAFEGVGCCSYSCVAHAGTICTEATVLVQLGANDQRQLTSVKHVHCQLFDSSNILMHLVELASRLAQNGITDVAEAGDDERAAAVGDADREVVGRGHLFVGSHAALAVVLTVAGLHDLPLALHARQVEHLLLGALWNEHPGQVTVQVAIDWFPALLRLITLSQLLHLSNQESGRI